MASQTSGISGAIRWSRSPRSFRSSPLICEGAHKRLTPESLSAWVKGSAAREHCLEVFRRSDFEAMLHYYKQNYPRPPLSGSISASQSSGACSPNSRHARPLSAAWRLEQYLGITRERLGLVNHSPSRSLCSTRCGRSRHAQHTKLACSLIGTQQGRLT
ncbi:MAG: hypothetical protein WAM14_20980 [Candidatus Nitrosopolaris sp.]